MATELTGIIHNLCRVAHRDGAGMTDGQLLNAFVRQRDADALAALVHRHGPMVWGVCRRLLRSHQDAEDAFQATFLVLVHKAAAVRDKEAVANWLWGVAHQTAVRMRATMAKRHGREQPMTDVAEPAAKEDDPGDDILPLLDRELSRLPDKYRVLIVLCDLEGKTRKEVALRLGCPEGTVAGRLARARTMLANRLRKHGLAMTSAALAETLSQELASACVPASLVISTTKAVTLTASGQAMAGLISSEVAALTQGVLKTMLLTKLKVATMAAFAMLGVAGLGAGLLTHGMASPRQGGDRVTKTPDGAKAPAEGKAKKGGEAKKAAPKTEADAIALGKPVIPASPPDDADSWSKPTRGLQARITFVEKPKINGTRSIVPYLELRNVGDSAYLLKVRCDTGHVKFELVDADGKAVRDGSTLPRSGPHPDPGTIVLPHDSSMRIGMHCTNWGVPKDAAMISTDSGAWVLKQQEKGKVFLRATIEGAKVESDPDRMWYGTIVTPAAKVDWNEAALLIAPPAAPAVADDAEKKALAAVERLGGQVLRNETKPGKPVYQVTLSGKGVMDADLKDLMGFEELGWLTLNNTQVTDAGLKEVVQFEHLYALSLSGTAVTDAGLKELARLKGLIYLNLSNTKITDRGFEELAQLKGLKTLILNDTKVTNAGVKELARLEGLTTLNLAGTGVTDAGLKELARLKGLVFLGLENTEITDAGLEELAQLEGLTHLDLSGTKLTDAAIKGLAKHAKLRELYLTNTKVTGAGLRELEGLISLSLGNTEITDAGLKELAHLEGLTWLNLDDTKVTDAGIKGLATLAKLHTLYLTNTKGTDAGIKELQKALPKCQIITRN